MELEDYLKELNKVQLLAPEEEEELWRRSKDAHDEEARCRIIEAYQPLVFKNALPFQEMGNIMDIIQEGTVGLIEAVESYDHRRGVAFSLFAAHRIRGRMLNFLKKEGNIALSRQGGWPMEAAFAEGKLVDLAPPVAEQAETRVLADQVMGALRRLPTKERIVLENVYMNSREAKDIAAQMHMSLSSIYRLQKTGVRRIRGMLSKFMQYWD